jgi:hypothetical protein
MLLVPEAQTESLGCVSLRLALASDVPEGWADLAGNASEPNAFHEPWFLKPALTHLASNRDIRLAEARDAEGRLVSLQPLRTHPRAPHEQLDALSMLHGCALD